MAKYKIIPSSRTIVQSPISIGHKAEKGVEAIEFDLTAWVETYGSGTLTVIMRRWGDAIPYPIALEIDENNKATWTLSDIDTAKAGMAYAQLNYIVGETVVKKSDIYTFRVMDSLTGEGEPPEAYESWLEHLQHLAAEAMAEVLDIEGIVTDKTLTVDGGIADAKATGDALALKADKSTTYTKTEVDQMIEDVEVETDTTLEIAGAPADAAETGRQIGLLKEDLNAVRDESKLVIAVTYTTGKYYTGDYTNWVINESTDSGSKYAVIDLSEYIGYNVVVESVGRASDSRSVALGDVDRKIPNLRWAVTQETFYNSNIKQCVFPITSEYHYLYVSFANAMASVPVVYVAKGQNNYCFITPLVGGYIKPDGDISSVATDRWHTDYIRCPENASIEYVGESNNANVNAIAFYDSAKNFISGASNIGAINTIHNITSPARAKYVRLSSGQNKMLYIAFSQARLFNDTIDTDTCYVSTLGSDTNSGLTRETSFATIDKAIKSGYKKIFVREGSYAKFTAENIDGVSIMLDQYYTTFVEQTDVDHPYVIVEGNDGNGTGIQLTNCNNWTFDSIMVQNFTQYGIRISKCNGLKMYDCIVHDIARTGSLVGGGIVLVNVNGDFYNCGAYNIGRYDSAPGTDHNDGFNIHGVGTTNFINCWGHNCQDDGISHHDACEGLIDGGEWYGCGKGGVASPTHGAVVDIRNIYAHDNVFGLYSAAEYDYQRARSPMFYNCVMLNNRWDLSYRGQSNKAILYNCKYQTVIGDTASNIIVL